MPGRRAGANLRQPSEHLLVYNWLGIIQQWLFPPTCLLCGAHATTGKDLCAGCERTLPFIRSSCVCCALPLAISGHGVCGECLVHPPAFDSATAPLRYREPVRHMIQALKFHRRYPHARLLGGLLAESLSERSDLPDWLIPVPLHPDRFRARGFNPSAEIARELGRRLQLPLETRSAMRTRATASQVGLSAVDRVRNLRRAFAVKPSFHARHVAIIDDVMTTGSTVGELAKALRAAGAERIEVWVCARATLAPPDPG